MTAQYGSTSMRRQAFTLVELLVVVAILALLVGLTVTVGTKMTNSSRASVTANTIRVLDNSLAEWIAVKGTIPPSQLAPPTSLGPTARPIDIVDGRPPNSTTQDATHSLRNYTALVMQSESLTQVFQSLDTKFVKATTVPNDEDDGTPPQADAYKALKVYDAWNRPIRFVHPAFHGGYGVYVDASGNLANRDDLEDIRIKFDASPAPISRSYRPWRTQDPNRTSKWVGDADEGICPGGRPYFYSAGQDGDPGTRSDNVYTVEPQYPAETARFK